LSDEERLIQLERRCDKLESIANRNSSDLGTIAGGILFVAIIIFLSIDFRSSNAEGLVISRRNLDLSHAAIALIPSWLMADDRTRSAIGKLINRVVRE